MDAWDELFADTSKVTGTVREKSGGTTRSAKLARGPASMAEEDFAEAAMHGINVTETATSEDRQRSRSRARKDVTGAAARSAVCRLMGVTAPPSAAPAHRSRRNGALPTATANGAAE